MTDKELRGLSRAELLQMLIDLSKQNDMLKNKVAELEDQLNDRTIKIEKAGSIAEASLALNGVFEAAEAAAAQYLENMEQCDARYQAKQREAEECAAEILTIARATASKLTTEAQQNAQRMTENAKAESEAYWTAAHKRIEDFYAGFKGLKDFLNVIPGTNDE